MRELTPRYRVENTSLLTYRFNVNQSFLRLFEADDVVNNVLLNLLLLLPNPDQVPVLIVVEDQGQSHPQFLFCPRMIEELVHLQFIAELALDESPGEAGADWQDKLWDLPAQLLHLPREVTEGDEGAGRERVRLRVQDVYGVVDQGLGLLTVYKPNYINIVRECSKYRKV